MSKEDLIYTLLRSKNPNEDNYPTHVTNNIDTSELDNEIRATIKDIREAVKRLGAVLTNKERKKIIKELYESLKKINNTNRNTRLRKTQKERMLIRLIEQNNSLVRKERFMHTDYDDQKLCCMDPDSFIFYVETDDFYKDISNDVIEWFDTSDYNENDDRIPTGINNKIIGKFKDELKDKVMTEFITPASKVYAYLDDNNKEHKNFKSINKCVRDKILRFNHHMDVLLLNKTIRCTQQRFKSDHHIVTTEEVSKIALSRKDDKRI